MRRFCPNLPGDLIDCETGEPSEFEGVVIPLADLDCRSVFYIREDGNRRLPIVPLQKLFLELERQIYATCKEQLASAKEGDRVRVSVHWIAETDVGPYPRS